MEPLEALRSSRVLLPSGLGPATIWFERGVITEVRPEPGGHAPLTPTLGSTNPTPRMLDVGDLVVFPGLVDC
ncbi:MAG TPA: hypothetical protein VFU02_14010, partial [Polyangiaceae bacterium]|nr:hypothetical protein [Polyangiaceae bacterium]